ncbi:hypothetical protein R1sor_019022 [Riccia sorocarpa]|uniref:Uncharacterized protein n=1 Tax=Riccia sorocarpa TaxID=122646 RepID=A0ABD3IF50_9MARC
MVIRGIDSCGPTARLKGGTFEDWLALDQDWDLTDTYIGAKTREGPLYTRQVVRGGRIDQSRLDRIYLTAGGKWIHMLVRIKHDGAVAISDHIPVVLDIQLHKQRRRKRVRKNNYLKLDIDTLQSKEKQLQVKNAWMTGWNLSPDPIVAWDLAWGRTKELYKQFRQEDREKLSKLKEQQIELDNLRQQLADGGQGEELKDKYKDLEAQVRNAEMLEASIMKRRCRIKWAAQGDDCTRYFFSCLKVKQAQEKMELLINKEGREFKEYEDLCEEVHRFYSDLYAQPETSEAVRTERRHTLSLIDKKATDEDNTLLTVCPALEETEETLRSMARNRAPGEDGLSMEPELEMEKHPGAMEGMEDAHQTLEVAASLKRDRGKPNGQMGARSIHPHMERPMASAVEEENYRESETVDLENTTTMFFYRRKGEENARSNRRLQTMQYNRRRRSTPFLEMPHGSAGLGIPQGRTKKTNAAAQSSSQPPAHDR